VQPQGKIKPVTLVAREVVVVDVAADNPALGHPGGVQYNAMTFNGTIPAPVIAVVEAKCTEEAKLPAAQNPTGSAPNQTITEGVSPNATTTTGSQ
jgi:hypothetical protein